VQKHLIASDGEVLSLDRGWEVAG